MGRQPDGNYVIPDGTYGQPDQTVYSARYNNWVNDVAATFNAVLPVNKGGTGASTAPDALTALGAVAKAGDTMTGDLTISKVSPSLLLKKSAADQHVGIGTYTIDKPRWFLSLGTALPEGGANAGSDVTFYRYDDAGALIGPALDIARADATALFYGKLQANGGIYTITSANSGAVHFGNSGTKYLLFDGTNYTLTGGQLLVHNNIMVGANSDTGTLFLNQTATKYLQYDGANFNLVGGGLIMAGGIQAGGLNTSGNIITTGSVIASGSVQGGPLITYTNATSGALYFGAQTNNKYLYYDGSNYVLSGGPLFCAQVAANGTITATSTISATGRVQVDGAGAALVLNSGANPSWAMVASSDGVWRFGTNNGAGGIGTSHFELHVDTQWWLTTVATIAYKVGGGPWADSSDARIKSVTGNYDNGLDAILTLQPVKFTYKGNDTRAAPSNKSVPDPEEREDKSAVTVPYANSPHYHVALDGKEFIGLVAQDCEQAMPEIITKRAGYIDGVAVADVRDLDTGPLLFALINAVKTLAARVEELEAR